MWFLQKLGRWNSMHIRIAYEIWNAQKRANNQKTSSSIVPPSTSSKPHLPPPQPSAPPLKRPPSRGSGSVGVPPLKALVSSASSNPVVNHSQSHYRSVCVFFCRTVLWKVYRLFWVVGDTQRRLTMCVFKTSFAKTLPRVAKRWFCLRNKQRVPGRTKALSGHRACIFLLVFSDAIM